MTNKSKTFSVFNFGCRVNSAETNQWSQLLINQGFVPFPEGGLRGVSPDIIFVNTCAVTKKGEYESISKIKQLSIQFPASTIIVSGCANLDKVSHLPNVQIKSNQSKEQFLLPLNSVYTHQIKDKFSHTNRYLLKIQSGCSHFCSYCTVPLQRPYLWSLPIDTAINTVNQAVTDCYQEIIITGVNIDQYQYGLSNLVLSLLKNTAITLISFGSVPLNSIDPQFIDFYSNPQYQPRLSNFLHIPLQSGSDKILKLMNRPYDTKKILETFSKLKKITSSISSLHNDVIASLSLCKAWQSLSFGTDIIVGFPGETDAEFTQTLDLCRQIGFTKIHTFRFSPRPDTQARELHQKSFKLTKSELIKRSVTIRNLTVQTTLPSHQKPEI